MTTIDPDRPETWPPQFEDLWIMADTPWAREGVKAAIRLYKGVRELASDNIQRWDPLKRMQLIDELESK